MSGTTPHQLPITLWIHLPPLSFLERCTGSPNKFASGRNTPAMRSELMELEFVENVFT